MKHCYIFFIFIFSYCHLQMNAQGSIQIYKTGNSPLVNNNITALDFDSQGRVWIGTANGLSVYDQGSWTTYTSSNSGLINNAIQDLLVDASDNVWVGTQVGVGKFNGSSWSSLTTSNGLSNNNVRSIGFDSQGNIWFGTTGSGVDKYNGTSFTNYSSTDGLAHDFVQGITEDHSGNMWFATSLGVSKFTGTTWVTYDDSNVLPSNGINMNDIASDSAGHIWTVASKGLSFSGGGAAHYDQSNWEILRSQNSGLVYNDVVDVAVDGSNAVWFATDGGGASYFDYTDSLWITINTSDGMPNNNCQAVGFDTRGNIWLGTDDGLAKLTPVKINKINKQDVTCDTIKGNMEIFYNSVRKPVWFSIDSGSTFVNSKVFTGLQAGNYHVMVTDSLSFVYGDMITLEALPVSHVDLGPDTTICENHVITLQAGAGFLTYLWSNGLTQQSITVDGSVAGIGDHNYHVVVSDSNQCFTADTVKVTVQDCSSVPEFSIELELAPNPVTDVLEIKAGEPLERISVFSLDGRKLMSKQLGHAPQLRTDLSSLPSGTYIIEVISSEGNKGYRRVVKI